MTHIGIICLQVTGHLNTIFPLARELQQRGHTITIFSGPEAQVKTQTAGFNFCEVYSPDSSPQLKGFANIKNTLEQFALIAETRLQKTPAMLKEQGVDALLVDLSVFEGGTIADYVGIPYINLSST